MKLDLVTFLLIIFIFQAQDERIVLVDNKCKCARITSRIIPSAEDPSQDIVERNIRIMYVVFHASFFHFVSRYFLILVVVCM